MLATACNLAWPGLRSPSAARAPFNAMAVASGSTTRTGGGSTCHGSAYQYRGGGSGLGLGLTPYVLNRYSRIPGTQPQEYE